MPFPNVHSARVKSPANMKEGSFRTKKLSGGVTVLMARPKAGGGLTAQAYRFDRKKFTVAQAKAWLKEHNVKVIRFEAASGQSN